MSRPVKVVLSSMVLLVVVVGALLATGVVGGDTTVTARAGDGVPQVGSLERADTNAEATVRAYLQAALTCDGSGDAVRRDLSGGKDPVAGPRSKACTGGEDRWADEAEATLTDEDPDSRGRRVWEVSGLDGLPDGFRLAVRMYDEKWRVDEACVGTCPNVL